MAGRQNWLNTVSAAFVALAALIQTPAAAYPVPAFEQFLASARPTWMNERGFTIAPMGFVRFCLQYEGDCPRTGSNKRVALTAELWEQLLEVNASVNRRISPVNDRPGQDIWSLEVTAGDCDDYAVQKRHDLIAKGWPAELLSLAVALIKGGTPHLVLTVRSTHGDLVLDNLRSQIISFDKTGYIWLKRQSAQMPRFWVQIDNRSTTSPAEEKVARASRPRARWAEPMLTSVND